MERFIGYLKRSFWVSFVATQRQAGVLPDKQSANAAVARWLREVTNARAHATTEAIPVERHVTERAALQSLPTDYKGRSVSVSLADPPRKPPVGYQRPLSVYDELTYAMPSEGAVPSAPLSAEASSEVVA